MLSLSSTTGTSLLGATYSVLLGAISLIGGAVSFVRTMLSFLGAISFGGTKSRIGATVGTIGCGAFVVLRSAMEALERPISSKVGTTRFFFFGDVKR